MPSILVTLETVFKLQGPPTKPEYFMEALPLICAFVTLSPWPPSLYQKRSPAAPTFHARHFLYSPARELFKLYMGSLSHSPDHRPWWLLFSRCTLTPRLSAWGSSAQLSILLPPPPFAVTMRRTFLFLCPASPSLMPVLSVWNTPPSCFLSFWFLLVIQHHLLYHYLPTASSHFYCLLAGFCLHITTSVLGLQEPHFVRLYVGVFETVDVQYIFFKGTRKKRRGG